MLDLYFIILSCCSLVIDGPMGGAPHIRLRRGGGGGQHSICSNIVHYKVLKANSV